jgi:hypothetical protein
MATHSAVSDPYRELGVPADATRDEIAAAYRARAKELHPDARPQDPAASERFKRVSAAYRFLSDPAARSRYDADRRAPAAAVPRSSGAAVVPPRRSRFRLTRRGARWAAFGGVVLVLVGIAATVWVVSLQRHDADLRARGVAVVATVVDVGGERRLRFEARDGGIVEASEPVKTGEEQPAVGARVTVHYDRDDPTNIVVDVSHTGRDVTLWIVAVKLMVGGAVLSMWGTRQLRRV